MNTNETRTRYFESPAWSRTSLQAWRAHFISNSLSRSSQLSYNTAVRSYVHFCNLHHFPIEPTPDTLSFYITFASFFVKPQTLSSYLSRICSRLEPHFPACRAARNSFLIAKTLAGIKRHHGSPVSRKDPLMTTDIQLMIDTYGTSVDYDDVLFLAQITLGFNQLLRLAELCMSDNSRLRDCRKLMMRFDLKQTTTHLELLLPGHKADKFFEGSRLIVLNDNDALSPHPWISKYLVLRDKIHPWCPELWLREDGSYPSRSWFSTRLRKHFGPNISGHSMRAGGATALAAAGVPDDRIRAMGRWSSDAYQVYIRQHSIILISQLRPSILSTSIT